MKDLALNELKRLRLAQQGVVFQAQMELKEFDYKIVYAECGIKIGTVISRIMYWIDDSTGERVIDKDPHHIYEKITEIIVDGGVVKVASKFLYNRATKQDECYSRELTKWNPTEWRIVEDSQQEVAEIEKAEKVEESKLSSAELGWLEFMKDETCTVYVKPDDSERGLRWANISFCTEINLHIEMLRLNPRFPSIVFL